MNKTFILLSVLIFSATSSFAMDYDSLYDTAEPFKSKLYHNVDPYEDEDNLKMFLSLNDVYKLMIHTAYYLTKAGINILLAFSIPFSTPSITTSAVAARKMKNQNMGIPVCPI